jgi:CubicO group peptidase (beta-lactamase class C family)
MVQCRRRASLRTATLLLVLVAGTVLPRPTHAQSAAAAQRGARVDSLFARWHTPESPGAAVLVMHRGETVHAKGYGMANLEHGVPIGPRTVFDIASVSKQFGAMAIALLEADGRLSLDDDVRRWIPELPDFGSPILIRHLVHHTSGIRDWPQTLRMAGWDYQDVLSFDQILRMAYNQRALNFPPGSAYAYSNTGYNLLAEIVQRVTGESYGGWTKANIFRPLGMLDTGFDDDAMRVVPGRADSYSPAGGSGWRRVSNSLTALASSSLHTTVEDLARWVANFESGSVGGGAVLTRMHERGMLTAGDTIPYAFGQSRGTFRGLATWTHTGSWAGFRAVLQRIPDEEFAVIILANTSDMNPSALGAEIASLWLGDRMTPALASAPASPAASAGANAAPDWTPAASELAAYAGRYTSEELHTAWTLEVRGDGLLARHFRVGDVLLRPVAPDTFVSGLFGDVRFIRAAAGGEVIAFTANADRVRNLRFDRARE